MRNENSFFSVVLLLMIPVLFFITCQKEYSYEGGPVNGSSSGTAVYTFEGAGGTCTAAVVSGNYYSGVALTAANTVQLEVNVTSPGTYNVSTSSLNGISFAASGNFTSTGMQLIILTGNGIPSAEGNSTFFTPVTPSCSFTVPVTAAPVAIANFTLAGAPGSCTAANVLGDYFAGTPLTSFNTVTLSVNVTSPGAYTLKTDTIDGISFIASGTFNNTGVATVVLKGSGTPNVAQNLTFTPMAGSSGCTFTVAVLPTGPLATYVLESGSGNPSPCVALISGTYSTGIRLSAAESVSIRVYVSVVGNFAISSNVVNGMLFTYAGTFTATGTQFIALPGSGTPAVPGSFVFIPQIVGPHPLGGQACGFNITVN